MISNIIAYLVWLSVWMLLTWPPTPRNLVIGLAASYVVSLFKVDISAQSGNGAGSRIAVRNPVVYIKKAGWFFVYMAVFLYECLKANIDVAYRVLHPDVPIRPGTVKVKIRLRSDAGVTFLANSVSLTPGTTTVDVDMEKGFMYVHWLYVRDDYDRSSMSLPIVEKFERILERIFE